MRTQSTPVVVETPYGALYVAVACADARSYHDTGRGNVTDLRGELWVATDPAFDADPDAAEHWTIRGRAYALHLHMVRDRDAWHQSHVPYGGGFRSDRGNVVDFNTKTRSVMEEALFKALDVFHRNNPGWEQLSRFMLHAANENSARGRAATAREEAAKYDETADGHRELMEGAGMLVPPSLLALAPSAGN